MDASRHPDTLRAVLLAAGEGSRLRPLTDHVPKPLLPIDGRAVIDRVLEQVSALEISDVTIVLGYLGDVLRTYLDTHAPAELRLSYAEQPVRHGSADALQAARASGAPPADTLVAATDTWWLNVDVSRVASAFRDARPMVAMGLRRWPIEQLPHRSCVAVDGALRVCRVIEKPSADELASHTGETALSGSPLYVFRADFWPYVERVTPSSSGMVELATALQAAIDDGHPVQGVEVAATRDITRPVDMLRHNFPYLEGCLPPQ